MQLKRAILFALAALGGFLVSGGAADLRIGFSGGGGGNFADFYRQQQIRLFSAVDAELSKAAETAITENFAAVKKADINLQSELGGRKAHFAAHLVGKFAESENRAFGWQLRAFAAQDNTPGANAGVFFRTASENILVGANAFADYESGEYGKFFRYSIGGEVMHRDFALAANYYMPITDDRKVNSTVAAFSREGYDANLKVNLPHLDALKARTEYYYFDGKGDTKAEDGFRFGMEYHPSADCRIGVLYDDGAQKFGGDFACSYTINSNSSSFPRRRESITDFTPDMFAAVSREYSQRIMTVATGPGISLRISIVGIVTTAMTTQARTITTGMTVAAITTRTTTESTMTAASQVANVQFTVFYESVGLGNPVLTTRYKLLMTLPPATIARPWVLTIMRNLNAEFDNIGEAARIISSDMQFLIGAIGGFPSGRTSYTITIVEGSEDYVGEPTTTTLTNRMTTIMAAVSTTTEMTILPVSTTTRVTTFATTTITLGANSAMGDMPPNLQHKRAAQFGVSQSARTFLMDSRLRGNDGLLLPHNDGGGKFLVVAKPPPPVLVAAAVIPATPFRHSRAAGAGISHHQKEIPALSRENDGKRRE